ncbi:hypothetical protein FYC62_11025 [Pedobacter aquae]|uniref:Fasciclin domain-containing protein n=1 Tax=Pedobacter aquae TaxID=2605747 RepID=A0A5C0VJW5_9SPHI|nr:MULTISPECIES: hypothetical protein [Pedobacter]QEK52112.1 hypothetical protein FYC62_11025 [Pedobacter aquae]
MMKVKRILVIALTISVVLITGCEKFPLQKSRKYETSFFQNNTNKTVLEFIESRPDLFSGLIDAIAYLDADPAYADIKEMFQSQNNTFLLLHNDALTTIPSTTSYWGRPENRVTDTDPTSPTFNQLVAGSSWAQYPKEDIAKLLRRHVIKGKADFPNLSSTPKLFDTYDGTYKMRMFMTDNRDGNIQIGNGPTFITPRTPNLYANGGNVIHVLNAFIVATP